MLSLWLALPISFIFWVFAVVALAGSIATFALCSYCLVYSLTNFEKFLGSVVGLIIWGWLAVVVGMGAYHMGSYIFDSMIARIT